MNIFSKSDSYSRRSAGLLLLIGVLAGVIAGGGVGVIAASSTKSVTVCASKKTNVLRYAKNKKCVATETKVLLNQSGVKGDTGATGAKGDAGAAGVNATLAMTQLSVCDGIDADVLANELCKMGMTGPGGGLIFFIDYNDEYPNYNYLEAAPSDGVFASGAAFGLWSTSTPHCGTLQNADCQLNSIYAVAESTAAIGSLRGSDRGLFGGKAATSAIVAHHDAGSVAKNLYAAGVADDYTANGKSDWWLPSIDELQKMQENIADRGMGSFCYCAHWSSSEWYESLVWGQYFFNRTQKYDAPKSGGAAVRPVRAF